MPGETYWERVERDLVEGRAVARGERRKADEEEERTPELCLAYRRQGPVTSDPCLLPKGHAGKHSFQKRHP